MLMRTRILLFESLLGVILLQSAVVWCRGDGAETAGNPALPIDVQRLACQSQKAHMPVVLPLKHTAHADDWSSSPEILTPANLTFDLRSIHYDKVQLNVKLTWHL